MEDYHTRTMRATPQQVLDAANKARNEILKVTPSHDKGYTELEEKIFSTVTQLVELGRMAVREKQK
jgi:hypothetical protein